MVDTGALLAVYDAQMRMPPGAVPIGVTHEYDGPLLRIVGGAMGRIRAPRDVRVTGAALDRLIVRQRDYFAARGQAVEWKTRAHDLPPELPERLAAAGFVAQQPSAVLIGFADEVAKASAPSDGVTPPHVSEAPTAVIAPTPPDGVTPPHVSEAPTAVIAPAPPEGVTPRPASSPRTPAPPDGVTPRQASTAEAPAPPHGMRPQTAGTANASVPSDGVTPQQASAAEAPALPDGVVLRQVSEAKDLDRIAEQQTAVWGFDCSWVAADLAARVAADPGQITILVAEAGDLLVCSSWAIYHSTTDFVALLGGTTLPEWRGRGLYRAMLVARAREAAARGYRLLHVDASPNSAPILRRHGFHEITTSTHYHWTPPA